jgi:hypothetical protein
MRFKEFLVEATATELKMAIETLMLNSFGPDEHLSAATGLGPLFKCGPMQDMVFDALKIDHDMSLPDTLKPHLIIWIANSKSPFGIMSMGPTKNGIVVKQAGNVVTINAVGVVHVGDANVSGKELKMKFKLTFPAEVSTPDDIIEYLDSIFELSESSKGHRMAARSMLQAYCKLISVKVTDK